MSARGGGEKSLSRKWELERQRLERELSQEELSAATALIEQQVSGHVTPYVTLVM